MENPAYVFTNRVYVILILFLRILSLQYQNANPSFCCSAS